ncbi:MAG: QacE family quaternary ammonium compound efflux SMR transporter [Alphaproteobacteria bacterium]|nr:MAG: QacE family quaternary ammonium compound efflux SMR transporter [Alphaproteobacteria bacterium]
MNHAILYVLLAAVNSTVGNVLLKLSRRSLAPDAGFLTEVMSPFFIGAIGFYAINVFLFARALDHMPVNVGYPILAASGFTLLTVTTWIAFGERLSMMQIGGLVLVVAGIFLLANGVSTDGAGT